MKKSDFFSPLQGSIRFRARGGFPERFLNLCNVRGVELFEPLMQQKELTATVRRGDYRRLRLIARRSGMVLRAEEKRGLPFFLRRHKARLALPVCAGAMLALAFFLSGFVWSIDSHGSENVSRAQVLAVMEELGLRPGVRRKGLDTAALGQAGLHLLSGRASWVGVNLNGTRAEVEVRDYIDPGEDETFGRPANIVADTNGLLLSLQAHSGKPAAAVGSGIKKGDLLISGVLVDRGGQAHFYEARGIATVLHDDVFTSEAKAQQDFTGYEKVQTVPALRVLHLTIPLGLFPLRRTFDLFSVSRQAELGGVPLPLWLIKQTRCYRTKRENEDAFSLLLDDHTRAFEEKYAATNVLEAALRPERRNGKLRLTEKSRCIDFTGKKQELSFEKQQTD